MNAKTLRWTRVRLIVAWLLLALVVGTLFWPIAISPFSVETHPLLEAFGMVLIYSLPGLLVGVGAWGAAAGRYAPIRRSVVAHWGTLLLLVVMLDVFGDTVALVVIGFIEDGVLRMDIFAWQGVQTDLGQLWLLQWLLLVLIPRILLRRSVVAAGWYEPQPRATMSH